MGKREIARKRAISPFPTAFSAHLDNFLSFLSNLKLSSANPLSLEEFKIGRLEKDYKQELVWERVNFSP